MVDGELWPLIAAFSALILASAAELVHARRVRKLAALAFGPDRKPALWARLAPHARALAFAALAWGLATLFLIEPLRHSLGGDDARSERDPRHVLLVLDVSPSMRLVDAGPEKKVSRMQRARALMESFFDRVPMDAYRVSVVAVYNGAKPVVIDTKDFEVVRNILGDLPMHYAFQSGKTKLFSGLEEAARIAKPWNPGSTTLVVVSDGDTVPANGIPKMPASVHGVIIVGVGDPSVGKFIDGRQSRQDVPTLKQIAARLGGTFHNGNESHLATGLIADAFGFEEENVFEKLTRREYALIAVALGALILAFLPVFLHFLGTSWNPGTTPKRAAIGVDTGARGPRSRAERNREPLPGVG